MIEVRLFATLRDNREKTYFLPAEDFHCTLDILHFLDIPKEAVSTLLINGFHKKPEDEVKDTDVVALFPPVGGG